MKKFKVTYKIIEDDSDFMTSTTITDFSTEISASSWEELKRKTISSINEEEGSLHEFILSQMNYFFDQDQFNKIFKDEEDFYFFTDTDTIKWISRTTTLKIQHI